MADAGATLAPLSTPDLARIRTASTDDRVRTGTGIRASRGKSVGCFRRMRDVQRRLRRSGGQSPKPMPTARAARRSSRVDVGSAVTAAAAPARDPGVGAAIVPPSRSRVDRRAPNGWRAVAGRSLLLQARAAVPGQSGASRSRPRAICQPLSRACINRYCSGGISPSSSSSAASLRFLLRSMPFREIQHGSAFLDVVLNEP